MTNEGRIIELGALPLSILEVLPEHPKAVLLVVHGISEHKGRYLCLQNDFEEAGYASYSFDQRGFGLSGGNRCDVENYSDYLHDLNKVVAFIRNAHPKLNLFLIGHSFGGLISAVFCIDFPSAVDGLVLSAPACDVRSPPWWLEQLIQVMRCVMPSRPISYSSPRGTKSHDPEVDIAFEKDPLVQTKASARFYVEFLKMNHYLKSYSQKITTPTLILQGREDKIVQPAGAQVLFDGLKTTNKMLIWYEGFFHEIFNEIGRERVISDMLRWLGGLIEERSDTDVS